MCTLRKISKEKKIKKITGSFWAKKEIILYYIYSKIGSAIINICKHKNLVEQSYLGFFWNFTKFHYWWLLDLKLKKYCNDSFFHWIGNLKKSFFLIQWKNVSMTKWYNIHFHIFFLLKVELGWTDYPIKIT